MAVKIIEVEEGDADELTNEISILKVHFFFLLN